MSAKVEMEGMQERGLLKINTWMTCRRISYIKTQERQNMDLHIFVLFIMRCMCEEAETFAVACGSPKRQSLCLLLPTIQHLVCRCFLC